MDYFKRNVSLRKEEEKIDSPIVSSGPWSRTRVENVSLSLRSMSLEIQPKIGKFQEDANCATPRIAKSNLD